MFQPDIHHRMLHPIWKLRVQRDSPYIDYCQPYWNKYQEYMNYIQLAHSHLELVQLDRIDIHWHLVWRYIYQ